MFDDYSGIQYGEPESVVRISLGAAPRQSDDYGVLPLVVLPAALLVGLTSSKKQRIKRLEKRLDSLSKKKQTAARKRKVRRLNDRLARIKAKLEQKQTIRKAKADIKAGRKMTPVAAAQVRTLLQSRKMAIPSSRPLLDDIPGARLQQLLDQAEQLADQGVDAEAVVADTESTETAADELDVVTEEEIPLDLPADLPVELAEPSFMEQHGMKIGVGVGITVAAVLAIAFLRR